MVPTVWIQPVVAAPLNGGGCVGMQTAGRRWTSGTPSHVHLLEWPDGEIADVVQQIFMIHKTAS